MIPESSPEQLPSHALSKYSGKTVETIPFRVWVQRVRQDVEAAGAGNTVLGDGELQALLAKNPAAKLLGFFEEIMSELTTTNVLDAQLTAQFSAKLRGVDAVKVEWIQKWVGEWIK
ncbi:hypothetical protein ETB97_007964 [Aspergillus alliaceus]|uniref:Uncharacterized protein n=1 Tax=Petromyces alliaceus TaxID=209559 RepID=A0A8H6E1G4_PETAA|nr:hypothetical protein ETB97_007964 [Aspergillus burnettii]